MRSITVLFAAFIFLVGCTKTSDKFCSVPVKRVPAYLWLAGYSASEVNPIYVNRYADYAFTKIIGRDTIYSATGTPTAPLDMTTSYEIVLPNVGRTYRIEKIVYHNTDSTYDYVTYGECDRSLTVAPDSFYLFNVKQPLTVVSATEHYAYLHK